MPYVVRFAVERGGGLPPSPEKNDEGAETSANGGQRSETADRVSAGSDVSDSDLIAEMKKNSALERLVDEPPDSLLGLERRARVDEETAVRLLHSLGYYEGSASFSLRAPQENPPAAAEPERAAQPLSSDPGVLPEKNSSSSAVVTLTLRPGPRYVVGDARVRYDPPPAVPDSFLHRTSANGLLFQKRDHPLPGPVFPEKLPGVTPGIPAAADPVLDAVNRLPDLLRREGYPFARVRSARYTLDPSEHSLLAEITLDPGPPAVMDGIRVTGAQKVHPAYLERLIPWKEGDPWNARMVDEYRVTLQQLGLFRSVEVKPQSLPDAASAPASGGTGEPDGPGGGRGEATTAVIVPLEVSVAETAFRTVSASARYATDMGFGIQGEWVHRNLFGNGEQLRIKAPLAQDLQGISADLEKPAFGRAGQKLLAGSSLERKKTDAYTQTAANAYTGLERRLTPHWWAEGRVFLENGSLNEGTGKKQYRFLSLALTLKRDTRDNPLDPGRGSRLSLTLAPHSGFYDGSFSTVAAQLDATAYYTPFASRRLVLAGRVALGSMTGSDVAAIPASLRYYAGGGGSVRGYAYQALGPRDAKGDPMGGRSFQEVNLEARFRVTESIGLVPFLDGGMVYDSEFPRWGRDLDWGVGLGLRYFTPIGPVRLDVAFPLTSIGHDKRYQIYISIGQAF